MTPIGDKAANRWRLQLAQRWVIQHNFYINDWNWGRMFVRMCPYFPFSSRICLNQHHWLANRMREQGIRFKQLTNAFLRCSAPDRLQELADSLTPRDRAARVRALGQQTLTQYGPTRAAYDLKKFRGQQIVQRIGATRRYEAGPAGLKAITALVVLRDKAIKPLLAAAQNLKPSRGAHNPTPLDAHYHGLRQAMRGVFHELGIAA